MIAQAGLPAHFPLRTVRFSTICSQLIALVAARRSNIAVPLKFGATALAGVLVTSATIEGPIVNPPQPKLEITRLATVRNETVVYRQERPTQPNADQHYSETEQIETSDQIENDDSPFARSVQIVRFVNPDEPLGIDTTPGAPRRSIREDLIKIGGFVTFRPNEDAATADDKGSTLPCTRAVSPSMDQVDDYLWEVYQRVPIA